MTKVTFWIRILGMIVIMWAFPIRSQEPEPAGVIPLNVMPVPTKWKLQEGKFRITGAFSYGLKGPASPRVLKAGQRLLQRLTQKTGLVFKRKNLENYPFPEIVPMILSYKHQGKLEPEEDESYALTIGMQKIILKAKNDVGILHGLETFLQLVENDRQGYYLPSISIEDSPRFTWRGLLIDSCRHFMPIEVIKRNLDGMAAVKLNVLHWHLTEDQGFRIECKTFPRLHELGSDGLFYNQDQVKEVIDYAAERGIRVMPEFDIPGHSTSWLVGYPELASAPGPYETERRFGIFNPCFNPILEETYEFFDHFFSEMSALFPDAYIHIGGDEVSGKHWDENPAIQEFKRQNNIPDNHKLQAYFNQRIIEILSRLGKKAVGWEQILQPDLKQTTIIQSYLGENSLIAAAKAGFPVINSKADELYIDLLYPTDFHYLYDPLPSHISLKDREKKLFRGSEATMWGELVSPETIDSRIWPRTAAIAERLWSPASVRNAEDMYRRLAIISLYLEGCGLLHKKNPILMLERLTRGMDIQPLKTLVEILKPIVLYDRPDWQIRYDQLTPLTRVVDAAVPDSLKAFGFQKKVNDFLKDRSQEIKSELEDQMLAWRNNHWKLKPIIDQSPALGEIEILSENLTGIAEIGLEALGFIANDKKAGKSWMEEKKQFLEKTKPPQADAMFTIIPAIEKLLEKVNQ